MGSKGDDTYLVDNALDVVDETQFSGDGIDTVRSSVDFDLNANGTTVVGDLEHLVLLGKAATGIGNALNNQITGNARKNGLSGLDGNDTLDGGAGKDTITGGGGNDLYIVDSKLDVIVEGGADAADQINSAKISIDISAAGLGTIENIGLIGKLALNATGNDSSNMITGNAGANKLSGLGGTDILDGGSGNDLLNGGTNGDFLTGGDGNDTLDGGAGFDFLSGGNGNDTYFVDSFGAIPNTDFVDEAGTGGIDTVISSAAQFSLIAHSSGEVENLTLAAGAGNTFGQGNAGNNVITGNEGDNTLDGHAGNDTINGGAGNDLIFSSEADDVINVALGNDVVLFVSALDGHDLITGFDGNPTGGQDVVNLDALLASLGILPEDRPSLVLIIDHGSTVDIRIDADKNLANGYEMTVATIQTADVVTIGADVILG
jgi:Ca2+-binding RTX toxin-like protein